MPRVAVIVPSSDHGVLQARKVACSRIAGQDSLVQIIGLSEAMGADDTDYATVLAAPELLEIVKALQSEEMDSILIDSLRDPGLSAARQISDIPVIGTGQAAFHFAALLADTFAVITDSRAKASAVQRNISEHCLASRVASIRIADRQPSSDDPKEIASAFAKACSNAIRADGAQAIVLDTHGRQDILELIEEILHETQLSALFLDATQVALKLAEALGAMRLSHSKRSYPMPPSLDAPGYSFKKPIILDEAPGHLALKASLRVIVPSSEPGVNKEMAGIYRAYCQPGVDLDATNLPQGPISIESEYDDALASPQIAQLALAAEAAGRDAVIIDCMADPGLRAAQEITSIPIIGAGIASMMLASILADKFSIITVLEQSIPEIERQIRRYGLASRVSSVRAVEIHVQQLRSDKNALVNQFVEAMRLAIEQDGAHLIVPGCTGMVGIVELVRPMAEQHGVPIVDQNEAVVRLSELLIMLSQSRAYQGFSQ